MIGVADPAFRQQPDQRADLVDERPALRAVRLARRWRMAYYVFVGISRYAQPPSRRSSSIATASRWASAATGASPGTTSSGCGCAGWRCARSSKSASRRRLSSRPTFGSRCGASMTACGRSAACRPPCWCATMGSTPAPRRCLTPCGRSGRIWSNPRAGTETRHAAIYRWPAGDRRHPHPARDRRRRRLRRLGPALAPSRCRNPWCCRSTCASCRPKSPSSGLLRGGLLADRATSSRPSSSCGRRPTIRAWSGCSSRSATTTPASRASRSCARRSPASAARASSRSASPKGWAAAATTSPTTISPRRSTRSGCSRAAASRWPGLAVETPFLRRRARQARHQGRGRQALGVQERARYLHREPATPPPARENLQQLIDGLYGQFIDDVARERKIDAGQAAPADRRRAVRFRARREGRPGRQARLSRRRDGRGLAARRQDARSGRRSPDYAGDDSAARAARRRRRAGAGQRHHHVRLRAAAACSTTTSWPRPRTWSTRSTRRPAPRKCKAIVLRIDSPGGTYPAADAMADAVGRARAAGKPVIVSMGDVAASGGYLAAVRADVIVAQPATITGSIGVFGIWPVALGAARHARRQGRAPGDRHQCRHVFAPSRRRRRRSALAISARARRGLCRFHAPGRRGAQARRRPARRGGARPRLLRRRRQARRPDRRAGRPAARAQHRQGQGRHRRSRGRSRSAAFPPRTTAGRRSSSASCGWPASTPRVRRFARRARCAKPWRGSASWRGPATSACRRCRRSGARGERWRESRGPRRRAAAAPAPRPGHAWADAGARRCAPPARPRRRGRTGRA